MRNSVMMACSPTSWRRGIRNYGLHRLGYRVTRDTAFRCSGKHNAPNLHPQNTERKLNKEICIRWRRRDLESILGVQLTDIAAQDVGAPNYRQVLRGHPRPVRVHGHVVEVAHQEVYRPVVGRRKPVQDFPELVPTLALAELAGEDKVGVEVVGDEGGGQGPEVELEDG